MERKAEKVPENRDKAGRFTSGKSGNPGGRPKKVVEIVAACREMSPSALSALETILKRGKAVDKIRAAEIIFAYGYGKPLQKQEISGPGGGALVINAVYGRGESDGAG